MRPIAKFPLILLVGCTTIISSCEKEPETEDTYKILELKARKEKIKKTTPIAQLITTIDPEKLEVNIFNENLRKFLRVAALEDEGCAASELTPILLQHLATLVSDPLAEEYFNLYTSLSTQMAISDTSEQYFGEEGEYTSLVNRRIRELERFWNMSDLRVNGEHTASLNDRDKLARLFYSLIQDEVTWDVAYEAADEIIALNAQSSSLPESLFFSLDGFLSFNKTIVIGDGLVEMISETGIDPGVAYSTVLAHEWAHQIQLDNFEAWYPGEDPTGPERPTLTLELEADFFAAYFLTHKRGATYNWKGIEGFLELSFTLGDCATSSPIHHGTPDQRMRSSRLGYELAASAKKKGHILSSEEVHEAFVASLPQILN